MVRKAAVLETLDFVIRKIADNENISAEERLKLVNELLDVRITVNSADNGAPETRAQ